MVAPMQQTFTSVYESRRSVRAITVAPLREVVNAIAFATRPRFALDHDPHCRSLRPSISGGALHPLELLLTNPWGRPRVMRYDAWEHRLDVLVITNKELVMRLGARCAEILPEAQGTALVLVGCPRRIGAVYENPNSILWRDAGALLQSLALAATAYRLGFCPLGILGGEVTEALGLDSADYQAVGSAIIGRPVS